MAEGSDIRPQYNNLIPRVVHRDYLLASGITDIDNALGRVGYLRSLGNDVCALLAEKVDLPGKEIVRNVHAERLDEMNLTADVAWQYAYANVASLMESGAFKKSITKTGSGNYWAVWIGETYTSSCPLVPEFYSWCCTQMNDERFMVSIASSQLVFVLQHCSHETLARFDSIVSKMLVGSTCQVSTAWFVLSGDGLKPLHFGAATPVDSAPALPVMPMIEAGINTPDANGITPLVMAAAKGDGALVTSLIARGADPNLADSEGFTPAMFAAELGNADALSALVTAGANINTRNFKGFTAAMIASEYGKLDALNVLVGAGAGLNLDNEDGMTALMLAIQNGHDAVVRTLIGIPVNIEHQSRDGYRALTIAAQYGRSDIIEMLLNIGAEVNPLHPQGVTAAMLACQGGHVETLKLLIAAGADLESITPHGTTAMGLAEHYKYEEIINLLRQARTHGTPGQHDDAKANTTRSGIAHVFKMFGRILNNR